VTGNRTDRPGEAKRGASKAGKLRRFDNDDEIGAFYEVKLANFEPQAHP
jgi:hypothetical protein